MPYRLTFKSLYNKIKCGDKKNKGKNANYTL